MIASGPGRIAASARQWMIACGNWDQLTASDTDALESRDLHIERSADPNGGRAVEHRFHHCPKRLDIEAQRYCRKLGAKGLQRIDHAPSRQHHIKDEVDFRLKTLEQTSDFGA